MIITIIYNELKRVLSLSPLLIVAGLVVYVFFIYESKYFTSIWPWLSVVAGILAAILSMYTLKYFFKQKNLKRLIPVGLFIAIFSIASLAFCLRQFTFFADDEKLHFKGFSYTDKAKKFVLKHPDLQSPEQILPKYLYHDDEVWTNIALGQGILLVLNFLACFSLFFCTYLEINPKKFTNTLGVNKPDNASHS